MFPHGIMHRNMMRKHSYAQSPCSHLKFYTNALYTFTADLTREGEVSRVTVEQRG